MATRTAVRYVSRRLSSGKVLGEEEKAAENVYIKKTEQEKLEKLARKGYKAEETPSAAAGTTDSVKSSATASSTVGVSTSKERNYAVVAGVVAAAAGLGWYLRSRSKKPEEVQD